MSMSALRVGECDAFMHSSLKHKYMAIIILYMIM